MRDLGYVGLSSTTVADKTTGFAGRILSFKLASLEELDADFETRIWPLIS